MRKRLYQSTKSYILKFSLIYWKQEEEEKKTTEKFRKKQKKMKNIKSNAKNGTEMVTITTHSIMFPNGSN